MRKSFPHERTFAVGNKVYRYVGSVRDGLPSGNRELITVCEIGTLNYKVIDLSSSIGQKECRIIIG